MRKLRTAEFTYSSNEREAIAAVLAPLTHLKDPVDYLRPERSSLPEDQQIRELEYVAKVQAYAASKVMGDIVPWEITDALIALAADELDIVTIHNEPERRDIKPIIRSNSPTNTYRTDNVQGMLYADAMLLGYASVAGGALPSPQSVVGTLSPEWNLSINNLILEDEMLFAQIARDPHRDRLGDTPTSPDGRVADITSVACVTPGNFTGVRRTTNVIAKGSGGKEEHEITWEAGKRVFLNQRSTEHYRQVELTGTPAYKGKNWLHVARFLTHERSLDQKDVEPPPAGLKEKLSEELEALVHGRACLMPPSLYVLKHINDTLPPVRRDSPSARLR